MDRVWRINGCQRVIFAGIGMPRAPVGRPSGTCPADGSMEISQSCSGFGNATFNVALSSGPRFQKPAPESGCCFVGTTARVDHS